MNKPDDQPEPKNAVIYCRISSAKQLKEGDGLNSQETRCREYAEYRDLRVVATFSDDVSGRYRDRPGMNALIGFLKQTRKEPHVVIIDDLNRLARDIDVHRSLRKTIAEVGGLLDTPTMTFGDDADSELNELMQATFSHHQARKNAEQTKNRTRARLLNGYFPFSAPRGYRYIAKKGCGKVLVRDEPVASVVQEALEGYASGRFSTQVEVQRFLESRPEYPKGKSNGKVHIQRISEILNRVVYAGHVEKADWDVSLRKANHEGLITLATFQKIQKRLSEKAYAPTRKDLSKDFPLRGFVECSKCRHPLTACWSTSGTKGKKHAYYLCPTKGCSSYRKSIRKAQIEGEFEEIIKTLRPREEVFSIAQAMFKEIWDHRLKHAAVIANSFEKQIAKTEADIKKLVERTIEATNARVIDAFENRIVELERNKAALVEKADNSGAPTRTFDETFRTAMTFLQNPQKLWVSGRFAERRLLLKLAFTGRIPYTRNEGFRTAETALPFKVLGDICRGENRMVPPVGIEPTLP